MPYRHLTPEARVELSALQRAGCTQAHIASVLGCAQATVSRELQRGQSVRGTYDARVGHRHRHAGRLHANARFRTFRENPALRVRVEAALRTLSPEQVAGRLKEQEGRAVVSASTIYRWIYDERHDLVSLLRCKKGQFRRRRGTAARIAARVAQGPKQWISARPASVMERGDLGDWEGDTVKGRQGETAALATAVDRRSGYLVAAKLGRATADETRSALAVRFQAFSPAKRRTITFDNGTEFSQPELLERALGMPVFFARPYHSWERGTNENTNGLLREYFPKGMSLTDVTQKDVDRAVQLLNTRPRKRLRYRTPEEVFNGYALRTLI